MPGAPLPTIDEMVALAAHEAARKQPDRPEDLTLRWYADGSCAVHHWNWQHPSSPCLRINWTEGATLHEALGNYIAALQDGRLRPTPWSGPDDEHGQAAPANTTGGEDPRDVEELMALIFAETTGGSDDPDRSVDVNVEPRGCTVEQDGWAYPDDAEPTPAATVHDALIAHLEALRAGHLVRVPDAD